MVWVYALQDMNCPKSFQTPLDGQIRVATQIGAMYHEKLVEVCRNQPILGNVGMRQRTMIEHAITQTCF